MVYKFRTEMRDKKGNYGGFGREVTVEAKSFADAVAKFDKNVKLKPREQLEQINASEGQVVK